MATIVFNPFTGTFDYVGSGGGGGGVTSIAAGHGITLTPDPITTTGTVALTTPIDPADIPDLPYLLLAGRTGTTNDALISTDAAGTITGATTAGFGLNLNANTDTTFNPHAVINFNANVTTIGPITDAAPHVFDMSQSLTWDTASQFAAIVYFNFASQDTTVWNVTGANGLLGFFGMLVQPNINGEVGQTGQMLCGFSALLDYEPIITANATGQVAGGFGGLFVTKSDLTLGAANMGDTLTVGDVGQGTHRVRGGGGAGLTTIATNFGWSHYGVFNSTNLTVDKDAGLWFPARDAPNSPLVATTVMATVFSENVDRALQHAGNGIFGDSVAPNTSAVLELVSTPGTPRAFLTPRMDNTDEGALASPALGMLETNTDTNRLRFYDGTAWTDFVPVTDRVALTAQAADAGPTTLAGATAPGVYRVAMVAMTTTIDLTAGGALIALDWTDDAGARNVTLASAVTLSTNDVEETVYILHLVSGSLTYTQSHFGIYGTADYALYLTVERLA